MRTAPIVWALLTGLLMSHSASAQPGPGPVEVLTPRRAQICLNGLWRFQPAAGSAAAAPTPDWGSIWVPGSWSGGGSLPGIESRSETGPWQGIDLALLGRAWYESDVTIPPDWDGRAVLLRLGRLSTDATVYANGVECGAVTFPGGEVDITKAVRPGQPAKLRILAIAAASEGNVTVYMGVGAGQTWQEPAQLEYRGLVGDVLLTSRPAGPHVSDVFIRASTRQKTLSVDVELEGLTQPGPVRFVARLLDEQRREEKRFEQQAATVATPRQTVSLSWDWPDPRLWDLGQPNLYTLMLSAEGAGIADECAEEFGFREFWLEGTRFFLNGSEVRLRPVCLADQWNREAWVAEAIDGMIDGYQWAGFNIGEQWPFDHDQRGTAIFRDLWAERADHRGFLLMGCALAMNPYVYDSSWKLVWDEPGRRDRWEQRMAADLRLYRNHPSIVMWATSGNLFGRYQDQDPVVIGRRDWYPHDDKARAGLEAVGLIREHDPTRPVFTHHGADIGDVHTCNVYLDMTPLQEREEWLSRYAESADMPFLPIEFGTPLHTTFMRGRNGFPGAISSEPLMTGFCAIYLGSQAYQVETSEYRAEIAGRFLGGQQYAGWQGHRLLEGAPAFQAVQDLFVRNTWRSWRTWGITAGMVPWSMAHGWETTYAGGTTQVEFGPGRRGAYFKDLPQEKLEYLRPTQATRVRPAGQALVDTDNTTLAWIAGSSDAFTEKDHHYLAGERVEKQAVLINDERTELPYEAQWEATVGGARLAGETRSGTVGTAQNVFLPIGFDAPTVERATDGEIRLQARIGTREHSDVFRLRIYPTVSSGRPAGEVLVFDPEGTTSNLLRSVGAALSEWDGRPAPGKVVAVGRNALLGGRRAPGSLEKHVAAGGRAIIFAQDPQWLRDGMGFRVARHVSRRFFPVPSMANHPLIAGLDAEDFRDWRGSGTGVPETWGGYSEVPNYDPEFGWHWGNRGSVSAGAIEKPHLSGWRPILEGEFDLAYSPLMELRHGQGLALYCTLDLEGRTRPDPVSELMTRRLMDYVTSATVQPRSGRTVYIGDEQDAVMLRKLGLLFEPAEALPDRPCLAVIGGSAPVDDAALAAFVDRGGKALMLPRPSGKLPLGFAAGVRKWGSAGEVPGWPECAGLSLSDLRLRSDIDAPILTSGPEGGVGAGGLLGRVRRGDGSAILVQLTPDMLGAKQRTYLRYSAWRLTRTLVQLLANLGAEFEMDAKSLDLGWGMAYVPISLAGEWQYKVEVKLPAATDPNQRTRDPGNTGEAAGFARADLDARDWKSCKLPGSWEDWDGIGQADGAFWLRREIMVPEEWLGEPLILQLGAVDDRDVTYFNGQRIGESSGWNVPRTYTVNSDMVHAGRNVIAIRVFDEFGGGGLSGRPDELRIGRRAPVAAPEGDELIANRDLKTLAGWDLGVYDAAKAELQTSDDAPAELMGTKSLAITVSQTSGTAWHVMCLYPGLGIQAGVEYRLTFWGRSDAPSSPIVGIEKNHDPYGSAGLFERVNLGPEWKRFSIDFTPQQSDGNVRFAFTEMATTATTYYFAAPSFMIAKSDDGATESEGVAGFYHPDYLTGHDLGDDPYRYYRW